MRYNLPALALAGGLGGGINATLCYLKWPVAVTDKAATFEWHIVPAGVLHGVVLVLVAAAACQATARWTLAARVGLAPLVGWLGGYFSWMPLDQSVSPQTMQETLRWPLIGISSPLEAVWGPILYFGAVTALLYLWLIKVSKSAPSFRDLIVGTMAVGSLGSLWWWIQWGPWYFALLHGVTWGGLVGLGLWRSGAGLGNVPMSGRRAIG